MERPVGATRRVGLAPPGRRRGAPFTLRAPIRTRRALSERPRRGERASEARAARCGAARAESNDCERRDDQNDGRVGRVPRSHRGPSRTGGEGVREGRHRGARPRRREPGPPGRALHRHHGTLGVGQVDPHALPGRARHAHVGPGVHRRGRARPAVREAADPAAPRPRRLRVPGVQPAADVERRREHHPAARPVRAETGQALDPGGGRDRRPGRPAEAPARRAVGRPAAAGGRGPGPSHPSVGDLRRRAHRQPRLPQRRRDPRLHAPGRRRAGPDHRHGDSRPGGRVLRGCRGVPGRRPGRRPDDRPHRRARSGTPQAVRELIAMWKTTLKSIGAHKRRLLATGSAVVLGVAFLSGTLVLGDTMETGFGDMFAEANAGTDAVVRSSTEVGSGDSAGPMTYAAFTTEFAQETLLPEPGQISGVLVAADDGVGQRELADRLTPALPDGTEAITGAALTGEQQSDLESDFLGFFKSFLLVFAGIALVVATFSIYNTFSILVAQRTRESALLRALGASRRQVLVSTAVEALVVGVLAAGLGVAAGVGLAAGLSALSEAAGFSVAGTALVVEPLALVASAVVGVVVTLIASAVPAVKASRVAPLAALRDVAVDRSGASWVRGLLGMVVTGVGIAGTIGGTAGDGSLPLTGLGALLVVVGFVLLGPVVARPVAGSLGGPLSLRWASPWSPCSPWWRRRSSSRSTTSCRSSSPATW